MIHLPCTALTNAEGRKLVFGPECTVEEHEICFAEPLQQVSIELTTSRYVGAGAATALIRQNQSHRVPRTRFAREAWWSSCNLERLDGQVTRFTIPVAQRDRAFQLQLGDIDFREG